MARVLRVADRADEGPAAAALRERGHRVGTHTGVPGALVRIGDAAPDLVLLDALRDHDASLRLLAGMRSRRETGDLPVALVAHGDDPDAVIVALEHGADVGVPRSVSGSEFVARIEALLRRRAPHAVPAPIDAGALRLDPVAQQAWFGASALALDRLQFELLRHLAAYPDRVQSRARLLARVWPGRADVDLRTVDSYVARLRDVLAPHGRAACIETVRGVGYRWVMTSGRGD